MVFQELRAGISGMIYDFLLYAGDNTFRGITFTEEEETMGVGSKTVLALSKTIKSKCGIFWQLFYFLGAGTYVEGKIWYI